MLFHRGHVHYTVTVLSAYRWNLPLKSTTTSTCGDCGATAQFHDHLLTVMKSPFVTNLFQCVGCLCQHANSLARCRQEAWWKIAAR